jgi:STE24 endopeptidase
MMDERLALSAAVGTLIGLRLAAELGLEAINRAQVRRNAIKPSPLPDVMDESNWRRSLDYALAKSKFRSVDMVCDVAVQIGRAHV